MTWKNTTDRYGSLSIGMHWLMLLLLVAVYACIELRGFYPRGSDLREGLKTWHFMLGLGVFALVFARLAIRFAAGATPPIRPVPPVWQERLAGLMHLALYVFLVAMPLLGWFTLSAIGQADSVLRPATAGAGRGGQGARRFAERDPRNHRHGRLLPGRSACSGRAGASLREPGQHLAAHVAAAWRAGAVSALVPRVPAAAASAGSSPGRLVGGGGAVSLIPRSDAVPAGVAAQRQTSTGTSPLRITLCVSLPSSSRSKPRQPCEAITIRSHCCLRAASTIAE